MIPVVTGHPFLGFKYLFHEFAALGRLLTGHQGLAFRLADAGDAVVDLLLRDFQFWQVLARSERGFHGGFAEIFVRHDVRLTGHHFLAHGDDDVFHRLGRIDFFSATGAGGQEKTDRHQKRDFISHTVDPFLFGLLARFY